MGFISWIIIGIIGGAIAKLILPGKQNTGFFLTTVLGIVGGLLGGFLGALIFGADMDSFWSPITWFWAIVGAVIVAWGWQAVMGKKGKAVAK